MFYFSAPRRPPSSPLPGAAIRSTGQLAFGGQHGEAAARVDRVGVADERHQRGVLLAVGVEIAAGEVDRGGRAELLDHRGFLPAPDHRADDLPGQPAGVVDLEMVAQHMADLQVARDGFGVDGQRRGTQHHGVPAALVGDHDLVHRGEHARADPFPEDPRPDRVEFGQRFPAQVTGRTHQQPLEVHPAEAVAHRGLDDAEDLAEAGLTTPDAVSGVRGGGDAVDERAVEVEECADLGSRRAGLDGGDQIRGVCGVRGQLVSSDTERQGCRVAMLRASQTHLV